MAATVLIQDDAFELLGDDTQIGPRRKLGADALRYLHGLSVRYATLEQRPNPVETLAIGRDLYRWLDGDQRRLGRLIEGAFPPLLLTIHCPARNPSPVEWALLHAPWELLADDRSYLAADALLQFSPQRRLGPTADPAPLDDYRLGLAFMAASPQGVSDLDYDAEESAILDAVGNTKLDLLVDESGEAEVLGKRLAEAGGLPVLHLSCHGHHAWRDSPNQAPRPVLMLEDGAFGQRPTDAPELLRALRPAMPRLLFLSACLTAAAPGHGADRRSALPAADDSKQPDSGAGALAGDALAHSLTSALIQAGLPAIIGWDGSVADTAATRFAATLYRRLGNREDLSLAVSEARRALLEAGDEGIARNWHLARLWLGGKGDGAAPLVVGARKRSLLPADHTHKDLLGKAVPVAAHAMFVGRRRELQRALRLLDAGTHAGVLLTGMGRLGKSSLAARIANRHRDDLALAVLHGSFGIQDLPEQLGEALKGHRAARDLVRDGQTRVRAALQQGEAGALQALGDLLTDLLGGPCRQNDPDGPALLLILDDFEQLLEEADGVRPVQSRHAGLVATLLSAFDPAASDSRLLVTSRFPFRLEQGGEDLAGRLARIELNSFTATAERKLTLRQQSMAEAPGQFQDLADLTAREAQLPRARTAARGNPGLLDLLIARLLLNPAVPLPDTEAALTDMEGYLAGGGLPESEPVRELLENIAVDTLLGLAGPAGKGLLQALTLFELPVPLAVAEQLAQAIGGKVQHVIDLALVEPGEDLVSRTGDAINISPLAAARLAPLDAEERAPIAGIVTRPLFAAWGGETGWRPAAADLQLARLALGGEDAAVAAACGAGAIRALEAHSYQAAAELGTALLDLLEGAAQPAPPPLYAAAARVIGAAGDGDSADALLAKAVAAFEAAQDADPEIALPLLDEYASRLYLRGQLDEALRIRTEEELPVYERLGDVREKAVTQGKIADILQARGQLDEALRIRTEEQLPVYERLGDVRSKAVTTRKVADVLAARGFFREAAQMIMEKALPPMVAIGATRDVLVFKTMAGIYILNTGEENSREEATMLLCQALADARRLDIPEAAQIEQILKQQSMDCVDQA